MTTAAIFEEILAARERRAARQAAALARFGAPLVSITTVTPGAVKDGWLPRRVLAGAILHIERLASINRWTVLHREVVFQRAGSEALYVVDHVDSQVLKVALIDLEDDHPLGRLWDLDVVAPDGDHLSRRALGLPPRRCLVCTKPAHACSRSRRHPPDELWRAIQRIVDGYGLRQSA